MYESGGHFTPKLVIVYWNLLLCVQLLSKFLSIAYDNSFEFWEITYLHSFKVFKLYSNLWSVDNCVEMYNVFQKDIRLNFCRFSIYNLLVIVVFWNSSFYLEFFKWNIPYVRSFNLLLKKKRVMWLTILIYTKKEKPIFDRKAGGFSLINSRSSFFFFFARKK